MITKLVMNHSVARPPSMTTVRLSDPLASEMSQWPNSLMMPSVSTPASNDSTAQLIMRLMMILRCPLTRFALSEKAPAGVCRSNKTSGRVRDHSISLRTKMIEAMQLRGFSPRTHSSYLYTVQALARYYHRSPDRPNVDDVQAFLQCLILALSLQDKEREELWLCEVCHIDWQRTRGGWTM